jgi:peptidyl-prolyl cis-trans isomerase SDCCAG10
MSNIYHTEPPTSGKVLVKTTYGDIDIELWPKEAPLACRNFVQLSLEGYYDNSPIHRVIKEFMVQLGDPTGTGEGGESIWGKPFKDEFHGRIKFNHRGQVAMANANKPNSNHSQFFITLGAAEWLDRKSTIFGKVTGDTIYNLLRIGEAPTDGNDRLIDSIKILSIEVLWNPFDDIIPRDLSKLGIGGKIKENEKPIISAAKQKKLDRKATKDKKLLSFGEDEEEGNGDIEVNVNKNTSIIHNNNDNDQNILNNNNNNNNTCSNNKDSNRNNNAYNDNNNNDDDMINSNSNASFDEVMREKMLQKRRNFEIKQAILQEDKHSSKSSSTRRRKDEGGDSDDNIDIHFNKINAIDNKDQEEDDDGDMYDRMNNAIKSKKQSDQVNQKRDEYSKLRDDLLRSKRAVQVLVGNEADSIRKESAFTDLTTPLEQRRSKYLKRKSEHGDRQGNTMAKLMSFKDNLLKDKKKNNVSSISGNVVNNSIFAKESYYGQILDNDADNDSDDSGSWHSGKLKFRKHVDDNLRMGGDNRSIDDYTVIDPREEHQRNAVKNNLVPKYHKSR